MKLTGKQLKKIIMEAKRLQVLKEEEYDCIRDYMAMGYDRMQAMRMCQDQSEYSDDDYTENDWGDGADVFPEDDWGRRRGKYRSHPRW